VIATLLVPSAIVFEATLSFLGVGVVPPTPSWGNIISDSLGFYQVAWWYLIFPSAALLVTTLAFNLLGDGVRDALDPRTERIFAARRKRRVTPPPYSPIPEEPIPIEGPPLVEPPRPIADEG
jgi:peptide/nickel transport system permease protein